MHVTSSVCPSQDAALRLTVEEVAERCHVCRETVRRWARCGAVDAVRIVDAGRSRWLIKMPERV